MQLRPKLAIVYKLSDDAGSGPGRASPHPGKAQNSKIAFGLDVRHCCRRHVKIIYLHALGTPNACHVNCPASETMATTPHPAAKARRQKNGLGCKGDDIEAIFQLLNTWTSGSTARNLNLPKTKSPGYSVYFMIPTPHFTPTTALYHTTCRTRLSAANQQKEESSPCDTRDDTQQ